MAASAFIIAEQERQDNHTGAGDSHARHWVFTENNPEGPPDVFIETHKHHMVYIVVGQEVGESDTVHNQGYFYLKKKKRLSWLKNNISEFAHFEVMRGTPAEASAYCQKDGYFFEEGDLPDAPNVAGGRKRKEEFQTAYNLAKEQQVSAIDPEFQIKYLGTLNKIADRELPVTDELDGCSGVWIYGPPGTGKTRYARCNYTNTPAEVYLKLPNKWWDHYKGQKVVLMDDVDPNTCKYLVQYIKTWTDRYPFKCEYKGGARDIRPETFIITSNYSPEECFPGHADCQAVRRRCDVIKFSDDHSFNLEDD